jgi:hypothetical protein
MARIMPGAHYVALSTARGRRWIMYSARRASAVPIIGFGRSIFIGGRVAGHHSVRCAGSESARRAAGLCELAKNYVFVTMDFLNWSPHSCHKPPPKVSALWHTIVAEASHTHNNVVRRASHNSLIPLKSRLPHNIVALAALLRDPFDATMPHCLPHNIVAFGMPLLHALRFLSGSIEHVAISNAFII